MSSSWKPASSDFERGVKGLTINDINRDTAITTAKLDYDQAAIKPLVMPIHLTSTFKTDTVDEYVDIINKGGYIYTRLGNPNSQQVECVLKTLEGGAGSLTFTSGMAAVTTAILAVVKHGEHIVATNPIYSGTHRFLSKHAQDYGIEYTWITAGAPVTEYQKAIKPNTRLLIGETPCNPLISVLDVEAFGKLGQEHPGIYTLVDTTYATPYLLQPIKYGVDMVAHSASKYLGGHTDLIAGALTTRTEELWRKVNILRTTLGNHLSPFDSSMLHRGMRTLHLRMERHCFNAQKVAEFLEKHPAIQTVHYPGLLSHPGHLIAKKQMQAFGGMMAFEVKGGLEPAKAVIENVRVVQLAVSLGGVESLANHAASQTHGPMIMTDAERKEALISDGLIRLSIGIENVDDLIKDLQYALDIAAKKIPK